MAHVLGGVQGGGRVVGAGEWNEISAGANPDGLK